MFLEKNKNEQKQEIETGLAIDLEGTWRREQAIGIKSKLNEYGPRKIQIKDTSFSFFIPLKLANAILEPDYYGLLDIVAAPDGIDRYMSERLTRPEDFFERGKIKPCWEMKTCLDEKCLDRGRLTINAQSLSMSHVYFNTCTFEEARRPDPAQIRNWTTRDYQLSRAYHVTDKLSRDNAIFEDGQKLNFDLSVMQNKFAAKYAREQRLTMLQLKRENSGDMCTSVQTPEDRPSFVNFTAPKRQAEAMVNWYQVLNKVMGNDEKILSTSQLNYVAQTINNSR